MMKQSPKLNHRKARHRNISVSTIFVSLKFEFSVSVKGKLKKQVCPETQIQKGSRGNVKGTSVSRTLHVKSLLIRYKIFRSCFLCTIVQFRDVLTNDDIVTLTRDFFLTQEKTLFRQPIAMHFKHVTSQVHSANRAFRYMTPAVGVEYTNPGHQKHCCQPEFWIHSEVNVGASCCTRTN